MIHPYYKVIIVAYFFPMRPTLPGYVGKILSLKRNSWKRIQKPDDEFSGFMIAGMLYGGAVHWLGESNDPAILAFDLPEEKLH